MVNSIKLKICNFLKYIKYGGVTYVHVNFCQPSNRFDGKIVLITGGSSGLGMEMAKEFLSEGARVIIVGRNEKKLNETAKELNNRNLSILPWDISFLQDIDSKMQEAVTIYGHIDIFINNAGIGIKYKSWEDYSVETFDEVHAINERAMFFMNQVEGKYLLNNKIHGSILNISSMASLVPSFEPYSVSKWGVNCITQGMARILSPYNITVNAIAPGTVMTNIEDWYKGRSIEDNAFYEGQPTRRFTLKEEIAALALFLVSGAARNICGNVVSVDGGRFLQCR